MGKHCYHPGRKRLARRRKLMFFAYDLLRFGVVFLLGLLVAWLAITILMEGGINA